MLHREVGVWVKEKILEEDEDLGDIGVESLNQLIKFLMTSNDSNEATEDSIGVFSDSQLDSIGEAVIDFCGAPPQSQRGDTKHLVKLILVIVFE